MIQRRTAAHSALLALATLLSTTSIFAQATPASPMAQDKAAPAAKKVDPGAKPEGKGDKGGPKGDDRANKSEPAAGKPAEKTGEPTVNAVERREPDEARVRERLQRRKHQQEIEHGKIATALHGQPMSEAMNQELSRHARRLARLERIKALAVEAKDNAVIERVNKLIEKENARHDKFTTHIEGKDDKGKDDKGKDDKGKDDKGKDDKGGAK